MRLANAHILVHGDHPPPPVVGTPQLRCTSLQEAARGGPLFDEDSGPGWARIGRGFPLERTIWQFPNLSLKPGQNKVRLRNPARRTTSSKTPSKLTRHPT